MLLRLAALEVNNVAHGAQLHAFHAHEVADVLRAFRPDADVAEAQGFLRRGGLNCFLAKERGAKRGYYGAGGSSLFEELAAGVHGCLKITDSL